MKNAFNGIQEIAMYFDKLTRRHNVRETLNLARTLFAQYLTDDWKREAKNDIHNQCQDIADAATIWRKRYALIPDSGLFETSVTESKRNERAFAMGLQFMWLNSSYRPDQPGRYFLGWMLCRIHKKWAQILEFLLQKWEFLILSHEKPKWLGFGNSGRAGRARVFT